MENIILEHEILGTLRRFGVVITAQGSDEKGHVPLDVRLIETSTLQYGTLVALLNNPNFKPKDGSPTFMNQVKTTMEEAGSALKYGWGEVANALEILEANGDIIEHREGTWIEVSDRKIALTSKGLLSYNTNRYIKEYLREKEAAQIAKSTLRTNTIIRITGLITVVLSVLTALISYFQYAKRDEVSNADFQQLIKEVHQPKLQQPETAPAIVPKDSIPLPAPPKH